MYKLKESEKNIKEEELYEESIISYACNDVINWMFL